MQSGFKRTSVTLLLGLAFIGLSSGLIAQQLPPAAAATDGAGVASSAIPDAPQPQIELAEQSGQNSPSQQPAANSAPGAGAASQNQSNQPAADPDPPADPNGSGLKNGSTQNCPTSQSSSQQPCGQKTRQQEAAEEVKEQEKQRVEGVVPTFNVTYRHDAVPLSAGQKMELSVRSAIDPFAFASAFITAGYHEAANDLAGFDWGAKGYFERTGIAYLDTFNSDILSTGVVPVIFRQDPRYFRLGYGSMKHRILYSLATNFIAKNDYNGKWGPNYGNVLGNFAAGEISVFYYPSGNSSFSLAAANTGVQIAEGAGGSLFNEFWPDFARHFLHKDPTHGLDAQARAQYAAQQQEKRKEKEERKQEEKQNKN
jgi:hypothetical protein